MVEGELFELWELRHARPHVLARGAQQLENPLQLVVNVATREQRSASIGKLCKKSELYIVIM